MQISCLMLLLMAVSAFGQSDFEALLELKKGFEKNSVLVSWDSQSLASNGCPQNWYGVVCIDGHVTSITLSDVGLVGNFSFPLLTVLQNLRNISISSNQLSATISNIGSIESLEYLDLSHNLFYGFLPSGIVNLRNLVLLNLSSNNFQGIIPSGFGNLENLKYLDLSANTFSGDIMKLLSQLGSVVHVDLSSNQFTGSLDLGFGNATFISSIEYLNISHNSLVGQLFAHDGMPFFDSLEVFDASNNELTGNIPPFQFVVSLQIIRLGSNHLSGSLPEALLQDKSMVLSELDFSLNQLQGPIRTITSATLKKLNLSSNKLSGPLPATVGHCAIVDLSNNVLSGELSRMQNWGNYVEVIELSNNSLIGPFPNQTSQFLRLTSLKISNNSLNGELPSVLDSYSQLKVIDLSHNDLSGSLIPSIFTSTSVTDLILSANNFTGPIPLQEIQGTKNLSLVSLDLSYNSFNGYLPPEISEFRNLLYLNLSNNKLEGKIPDDLPSGLKGFDVSSNNLSGVVPDNLRRFPDSAFHPGNPMLIFRNLLLSPEGAPKMTLSDHQSGMKRAFKISLIASMAGTASVIAILCILINRTRWQKNDGTSVKKDEGHGSVAEEHSSLSHTSAISKNLNNSVPSFSFHQTISPSSHLGPVYDQGDTSSVQRKLGVSSPMSPLSSSNPSPKSQRAAEHPGVLQVYSPEKIAGDLHLFDGSLAFTAEELSQAPAEVIGRSCHGCLYKATLDSGYVLAVKWLKEGIAKGRKEFARELKKLGNIRHPNLVSVQGFYWGPKDHEKMIISNYINGNCLVFYLQETEPRKLPPLSLDDRLRIAVTVARCLNYLHHERAIPHGNLKSTNILLDPANMNPLLTDYSLHRILTSAATAEQVVNVGALGYRPPEFASSSKPCPSLKSDVYAFGVILLELITGKSSAEIASAELGVFDLTEWVRLLAEENRSHECTDKVLVEEANSEVLRVVGEMLQVALRCVLPASERPDMKTVFEDLAMIVS